MQRNNEITLRNILSRLKNSKNKLEKYFLIITCILLEELMLSTQVKRAVNAYIKSTNSEFVNCFLHSEDVENELVIGGGSEQRNKVHVRYLKCVNGRIELSLILSEETTLDDIKSSWSEINDARNQLREVQGSDIDEPRNELTWRLYNRKENGASYTELARQINEDILLDLCEIVLDEKSNDPSARLDALIHRTFSEWRLQAVMMKKSDIQQWLDVGLEEIRKGYLPWVPERGPVNWLRVRDTLRFWKHRLLEGKIVISQLSSPLSYELKAERTKAKKFLNTLEKTG